MGLVVIIQTLPAVLCVHNTWQLLRCILPQCYISCTNWHHSVADVRCHALLWLACCCRVRLVALDGYTFGVKVGSTNYHLRLSEGATCFGAAELAANSNPLDLRLRCIRVRHRVEVAASGTTALACIVATHGLLRAGLLACGRGDQIQPGCLLITQ